MVTPFDRETPSGSGILVCDLVCKRLFYPMDSNLDMYLPIAFFTRDSGFDVVQLTAPRDDWKTLRWVVPFARRFFCC